MNQKTNRRSPEKPSGKLSIESIAPIIVAVLGLIGVVTAAYLQFYLPHKLSIEATQTAEARLTLVASSMAPSPSATSTSPTFTLTPTPTSTLTPVPTSTPMPTNTATPNPSPTPTNTPRPTPTPTLFCERNGRGGTEIITIEPPAHAIRGIHIDLKERGLVEPYVGFSLWEVEIYGPGTGNLSMGATAIAGPCPWQNDDNCRECSPPKAIDGNMSTRWSTQCGELQRFTVTFSTTYDVNQIVLRWEHAYAREYCITEIR
jgi:hypothetical protein